MERQEHMLTNRSGKRMASTLMLPDGTPRGTIILLHGLGGLRDQVLIATLGEQLAEEGYVTFAFDDSNAVRSLDGRFFESTTTGYIEDVEGGIAYAQQQSWCTAPLTLLGHSMGGFVATHYASRHPGTVQHLVLLAPAMSWKSLWGASIPILFLWYLVGYKKFLSYDGTYFPLGRAWIKDFFQYDAFRDAPKVSAPTLIISAEQDATVAKPSEHRRFARRFPQAVQTTIAGADHDFDGREGEVRDRIVNWLGNGSSPGS